jgi:tetratricopeptide (TPR) repeat protein
MEQQAVALDDSLGVAHSVLAAIYVQEGEYDQAITEAERGITLDPNSAAGYSCLAEVLNSIGKPAEALLAVERAMRLDPRNVYYYEYEQGWAYTQLGQNEEAISTLKRYLAHYPDHFWSHVLLTLDYSSLGDDSAAEVEAAEVRRAIARDPKFAQGYLGLAKVMNATGRPVEALAAVEKAMLLYPFHDFYEQGVAFTELGRWEEAISVLKRISDYSPWPHVWLVIDYVELGRDDVARAEVAEVLRLDPQFSLKMTDHWNKRFHADLRRAGLK